ncbi:hypothetical protein ITQ18_003341 [Salmonella enterica subsp. enterica serovar Tennessee]|uniref:Outer membrane protein assembly factor BamE n=4 Tax=Salmonella enterica I TaxID=59201 RepID=A0A752K2D2_SALMU|nr:MULTISPECIES: hypothetical protein [Enterobacteriaceae]EAA6423152.1 hypothetical protein [Salmonella enterica subsp. enterica serovar Senftenberg]EAB9617715.1 hypothetical protein [Salmonella enterica subsp. enterica serovar Braenderup]EBB2931021.1 hypothetical protein [Salmonella enterica subsp. enterica serovar Montevideo]EBG0168861.1 hypothetical protein [Salmonella enterica subsp. enterica serovar Oslo]EBK6441411.1 hypothetical protein [Salmonella enterica subsp. enterica serovar Tennes
MKKILIPAIAIILAGCVYMGKNFDETKLASISKGETTKQQVVSLFGEPTTSTYDSDGNQILLWSYSEGNALGGANSKILSVKLHDGKVESYSVSKSAI